MYSKVTASLALAAGVIGCVHVQRGPTPLHYRRLGDVPQRTDPVAVAEVPVHKVKPNPTSDNSSSIIYKRIPTDREVRELPKSHQQTAPLQPTAEAGASDRDREGKEKKRLERLLDMELISREDYERQMGVSPQGKH